MSTTFVALVVVAVATHVVDGRDAAATAVAQLVLDHFALAFRVVLEAYLVQRLLDALVVIGPVQALVLATCFGAALRPVAVRASRGVCVFMVPPSAILIEDFAARTPRRR